MSVLNFSGAVDSPKCRKISIFEMRCSSKSLLLLTHSNKQTRLTQRSTTSDHTASYSTIYIFMEYEAVEEFSGFLGKKQMGLALSLRAQSGCHVSNTSRHFGGAWFL